MRQTTVRWIAIAIVGAMIAVVGVGVVAGGGDPVGSHVDGETPRTGSSEAALADGPHVLIDLCAGVACPVPGPSVQQRLLDALEGDPRVASTLLVTSEQRYQLFLDRFGDQQDLVDAVDPADVPALIQLDLYDPASASEVAASYRDHEGVASAGEADAIAP